MTSLHISDFATTHSSSFTLKVSDFLACPAFSPLHTPQSLPSEWVRFEKCSDILILGTGGSSLGGQALQSILSSQVCSRRVHFLDNVDPETFYACVGVLVPEKTGVIIISKSGATLETLAQTLAIINIWELNNPPLIAIITDPVTSPLRELAISRNWLCWDHPADIGGRFSVFSIVGQAPALLMGFDWPAFIEGGRSCLALFKSSIDYQKKVEHAAQSYMTCFKSTQNESVLWVYGDKLLNFSRWWAQLWAESLGKKSGTQTFGLTPILARGTVDQHSQLQLYLDGPQNKVFTLLKLQNTPTHPLPYLGNNVLGLSFLKTKTLQDVFDASYLATRDTLSARGCSYREVLIEQNNIAYAMGTLMVHTMLETLALASLAEINPFDQPAVEDGKKRARERLT